MAEQRLNVIADRLEKVCSHLERGGGGGGGATADNDSSEIVEAFNTNVVQGKLKSFLELSKQIGGEVAEQALLVKKCFDAETTFLILASKHRTPKPAVMKSLFGPVSSCVDEIIGYCEKRRSSKVYNHLMTVKEGIGCMGWITVAPKPAPYVKECGDQSLFYGNRVKKDYKGKDDTHVQWVNAYQAIFKDLTEYVKTYHTTGVAWNPEGAEVSAGGPPPPARGPPPPPPPGPAPPPTSSASSSSKPDSAALFDSINKGSNITANLKKVTKDMQTHKNPELRSSSVVKDSEKKPKSGTPVTTSTAHKIQKPPKCELVNNKWIIEYQDNKNDIEITPTDPKETVYIYKCTRCTIKVYGKLNSIIIDSCKRVGLVFDTTISCVEAVNSQSVQIQVTNTCPTVSIDKCDGCQIFLNKKCLHCEIVSAKSSEMNISVPVGADGDFSEFALPEQYKSTWNGKKFVTVCTDINC